MRIDKGSAVKSIKSPNRLSVYVGGIHLIFNNALLFGGIGFIIGFLIGGFSIASVGFMIGFGYPLAKGLEKIIVILNPETDEEKEFKERLRKRLNQ